MGLLALLKRWLLGETAPPISDTLERNSTDPSPERTSQPRRRRRLAPLRHESTLIRTPQEQEFQETRTPPYAFAHRDPRTGTFLNLSTDADQRWLEYYGLPVLHTPADLANLLGIPLNKLAWLTCRFYENYRPQSAKQAHYHFRWLRKRSGGHRLIEAPKSTLRSVQQAILRDILCRVPVHDAAHGFVSGRSILTNAQPHVGKAVLVKFDLADFYTSVRYSRVVAIFRTLGFSREVALWLARLTTSAPPTSLVIPLGESTHAARYLSRHLPQGAPTSPALANLSAFSLDVRLSGLARSWNLTYTRYADDLCFSGDAKSIGGLRDFIPLVRKIIRSERFRAHRAKLKVVRANQRQLVTGVVVNERTNIARREYDRLKATLTNCVRHGPHSQNRDDHPDFAAHLRGRIAHVMHLNKRRGEKLLAIFNRIRW